MADLKVIIKALFEGSDEINKAKDGIQGVADSTKSAGDNADDAKQPVGDFGDVLTSALGTAAAIAVGVKAVAEGLKAVYDAAKEAAELDLVEVQFENITDQAGLLSSTLLVDLSDATKGVSSNMQIMSGTTAALSSGLAQNEQDLIDIATASADLGIPMNDFVEVLNNVNETKLSGIGVTVDDFKGKVEALVADGMPEKAAQLQVALEGVGKRVGEVGSFADTSAGKFAQFEAAQQNWKDHTKEGMEELGGTVLPIFTQALNNITNVDRFDSLKSAMTEYGLDIGNLTDEHEILWGAFTKVDSALVGQMQGVVDWTNSTVSAFHSQGMSLDDAKAKTVELYNSVSSLDELPLDAKELGVDDDELIVAQNLLDFLNASELADKDATVTYGIDDSSVKGYTPPTKTGTVVYQPNSGMNYAVGGAVNAGNTYNWQEYGYRGEVFMPSADGFVLSRADAERALAKALYGGGSAVDPEAIGKAVAQAMSGITSSKKGGNVYNLTMPTSSNPADIRTAFELMEAWA